MATDDADFLSTSTAEFKAMIACWVSSFETLLTVVVNAEPSLLATLCLTTRPTFWNPKMNFVSLRTTYLPVFSGGSVVNATAALTWPLSRAS